MGFHVQDGRRCFKVSGPSLALRPVTVNEDYDDGDLTMLRV